MRDREHTCVTKEKTFCCAKCSTMNFTRIAQSLFLTQRIGSFGWFHLSRVSIYFLSFLFFFRNIKWSLLAKQKFVTPRIYISFFLFMFVLNFKFIKIEFQFSKFHPTLLIFTRFSLNTCLIAYANANRTMSPRGK